MKDSPINLRLLIDGCLQGNRLSQRRLYERYYGYGMSVSLRYTSQRNEAAEVLNDAFLKIFNNLRKYDSAYPFEAWIRRIIVNQAIDHYRSQQKKPILVDLKHAKASVLSYITKSKDDSGDEVLRVLQILPPMYRMVFNLYVMEEYKHHEIAELLNISASTSRSNLARAKDKLRAELTKKNTDQIKVN